MGQPVGETPRFISEETVKYLIDLYHSTSNSVRTWTYDKACVETEMQDTCKKVGDFANTSWGWTKYFGEQIAKVAVSGWRTLTLQTFWPISGKYSFEEAVPFLRVVAIGASISLCVFGYRLIFPKPIEIVQAPQIKVENYLVDTPKGNRSPLLNSIRDIRLTGE